MLHPHKRRWLIDAGGSSGKTFVLVMTAVVSLVEDYKDRERPRFRTGDELKEDVSPQRILIVTHSEPLRKETTR